MAPPVEQKPKTQQKAAGCVGRLLLALGVLIAAYIIGLALVPPVQTATRAALLLPELVELPVRPLLAITDQPQRVIASYGSPPDRMDVYVPAGNHRDGSLPGVVLVLGIAPQPIDHPEVTRVAEGISRLGVVVGVQDSTVLRQNRIVPEEAAHLADAFLVLADRPEVDRTRIGLVGFSAGASVALIAAADERIADDLRYVSNFGGYARADMLLVDVATQTMEVDGEQAAWESEPIIRQRLLELMLERVDAADREPLREVLEPVIRVPGPPSGPDPGIAATFEGDALAAYRLFTAPDRATAEAALAQASDDLREELELISPLAFVEDIQAYVFTMHGVGDDAIPITHAHLLNDALPREQVGYFAQFGRFGHAQPGREGLELADIPDLFELAVFLHHIVAAATE
jgi:fermentation-respiration switch protein FrsA (DUF1100 family)